MSHVGTLGFMTKPGRKSLFNEKIQATIVRLVEEGKTEEQIAEIIGVSRTTISNWKGKHAELLYAIREARQVADELVEAALFSRATGYSHPEQKVFCEKGFVTTHDTTKHYPPDTQAAMFWLRNRQPDRWREKNESDVNVNNYGALPDEQLKELLAAKLAKMSPEEVSAILGMAPAKEEGGE